MTRVLSLTGVCRALWTAVLVLSAVLLSHQVSSGLNIDTSFTAMVPLGKRDPDRSEALEAARTLSDQAVILSLQSSNAEQLESAVVAIQEKLATATDVLSVSTDNSLPDSLLQLLSQYPYNFLNRSMLISLTDGDIDDIVQQRVDTLLAPTGELTVLDFNQDPFNTLGGYINDRIEQSATSAVTAVDGIAAGQVRNLSLQLHGSNGERAVQFRLESLFDQVQNMLQQDFPAVKLQRSGVFFFARQAAAAAKKDINIISIGSLLGTVILLVLVFRSLWPLIVPILSIAVGVVFAFALVHTVYGNVHVFSIVFGASLIGIVIDYSIHYFYHGALGLRGVSDQGHKSLHRALLISLFTSVVGYAALALAGIELLEKIAVFSVAGVTASWLTVMSIAGPLSARLQPGRSPLLEAAQTVVLFFACRIAQLSARFRYSTLLLAFLVGVMVTGFLSKSDDDPRSFIQTDTELLNETRQVMQQAQATEPGRFLLVRGATEEAMFESLTALYAAVEKQPSSTIELISVLDWLPAPEQQRQNHTLSGLLYESQGAAHQLYTILGLEITDLQTLQMAHKSADGVLRSADLFANTANALPALVYQSDNAWFAYALIRTTGDSTVLQHIVADIGTVEYVDTVAESRAQLAEQRRASLAMLVAAYAVVGGLLLVVYRRRSCLSMLLIPAVATVVTLLLLSVAQVPLNIFHTMALFLILGLGMDYSVFLAEMSVDKVATRQAILLSALTSMLSFGLLALSSVPVAQGFGLTVFIGNSFNLLGAFVMSVINSKPAIERSAGFGNT